VAVCRRQTLNLAGDDQGTPGNPRALKRVPEDDDSIGIWIRRWFEQDGVDHREDGRVCIDAERERQENGRRETRLSPQTADDVHDVLPHTLQPRPDPYGARVFWRACGVAKRSPRRESCLRRINAAGFELLLLHGAMELDFFAIDS
jgi:hypothetical protein